MEISVRWTSAISIFIAFALATAVCADSAYPTLRCKPLKDVEHRRYCEVVAKKLEEKCKGISNLVAAGDCQRQSLKPFCDEYASTEKLHCLAAIAALEILQWYPPDGGFTINDTIIFPPK